MTKQFDLDAFKAFVASKPASLTYDTRDYSKCALGQFGFSMALCECQELGVPEDVYEAAAYEDPATFGALSDRLSRLSHPAGEVGEDDNG